NIIVVGSGVDPKSITGGHGERFRQRKCLDGPIVFYIGVHAYDKGTVHLIEAMRLLWERGSNANLVLAGAHFPGFGGYLDSLPQETRDRCLLLGRVDEEEKRDLLAAGDVFVMPSRTDSFGMVYLEAWLYQKPVIGAIAGGVPDVITHGEDGLLVPFGNVAELAKAIERLLQEKDLAKRLGQAGYEKTMARHTWDHKYAQVREVYEELARS
ncbi:MAG: glycosyltransferase family 4 protein, partial [Chloroflexota bacterium]